MEQFKANTILTFLFVVGWYWAVTGAIELRDAPAWEAAWWYAGVKFGLGVTLVELGIKKKIKGAW